MVVVGVTNLRIPHYKQSNPALPIQTIVSPPINASLILSSPLNTWLSLMDRTLALLKLWCPVFDSLLPKRNKQTFEKNRCSFFCV